LLACSALYPLLDQTVEPTSLHQSERPGKSREIPRKDPKATEPYAPTELHRARAATYAAGLDYKALDENVETTSGRVSISTMHLAKGLEFRAVAVMACDDEVIPLQERIETVADDSDLEEVYNTERHLLYVACTRARDHLLVSSVEPASEFLDDLRD
jgi:superfamily I DNA/RNA helicase